MIRVEINKVDYTDRVTNGFSIVEMLDEELDNGNIILPRIERFEPFDNFDKVDIYFDNNLIKSYYISNDTTEVKVKNPVRYEHNLTLIEMTKRLEKFFVDGKTFTQPVEGEYEPYTLLDVVEILRAITPIRHVNDIVGTTPSDRQVFKIPQETEELLGDIEAPEFNFKEMTLRECLDEVASVIDGNVFLDSDENLRINLFNDLKDKIENFNALHKMNQKDMQYYGNTMVSNMMNTVVESPKNDIGVAHSPFINGKTNTRSEAFQWDFFDAFIPTQHPIYKVKEVVFRNFWDVFEVRIEDEPADENLFDGLTADGVNRAVFEEQYANTLPFGSEGEIISNPDKDYQNSSLTYRYGEKNISIPTVNRAVFGPRETLTLVMERSEFDMELFKEHAQEQLWVDEVELDVQYNLDNPQLLKFDDVNDPETYIVFILELSEEIDRDVENNDIEVEVRYQPIKETVRSEVLKDSVEETPFKTYIQGNQQTRIIDFENFTNKQKAKVNRLGLADYQISHRVKNYSDLLNLGDFTNDGLIVTKRELIFYRDYIRALYQLNKNFNKSNQFVGIDSEIRQWEIGESGRTVERNINYEEYVYISTSEEKRTNVNDSYIINESVSDKILETFDDVSSTPINVMSMETLLPQVVDDGQEERTPNLILPLTKYYGGSQLMFHFSIDGNLSIGDRIKTGEGFSGWAEEFLNSPSIYTNKFARLENINLKFKRVSEKQNLDKETRNALPFLPENYGQEEITSGKFAIFKDNLEKLSMGVSLQFLPQGNVIIGNEFLKKNKLVAEYEHKPLFIRFYNSDKLLTTRNKAKVSEGDSESELNINIDYSEQYIEILNNDIGNYNQWAICDDNGNTYLISDGDKKYINFNYYAKQQNVLYSNLEFNVKTEEFEGEFSSSVDVDSFKFEFIVTNVEIGAFESEVDVEAESFEFSTIEIEIDSLSTNVLVESEKLEFPVESIEVSELNSTVEVSEHVWIEPDETQITVGFESSSDIQEEKEELALTFEQLGEKTFTLSSAAESVGPYRSGESALYYSVFFDEETDGFRIQKFVNGNFEGTIYENGDWVDGQEFDYNTDDEIEFTFRRDTDASWEDFTLDIYEAQSYTLICQLKGRK